MIDTIRLHLHGTGFRSSGSWRVTNRSEVVSGISGEERRTSCFAQCEETGARLGGAIPGEHRWAEVSLPRFALGRNSRVLTVDETDDAIDAFVARLKASHRSIDVLGVSRVDVCAQFKGEASDWIPAHRQVRHPKVRRQTCEYFGQSLHWIGKELRGRIYDKLAEQSGKPGQVMRVEWQARSNALRKLFHGQKGERLSLDNITGQVCYDVLRELCLPFQPAPLVRVNTLPHLLAVAERDELKIRDGRTLLEAYLSGKSRRHQRRLRKAVSSASLRHWEICWDHLLPADSDQAPIVYDMELAA